MALSLRLLVLEAVWCLVGARLALAFRPFARIVAADQSTPADPAAGADPGRVVRALEIARRKVPWDAKCFESALALRTMLHRRSVPTVLHYGVAHGGDNGLRAHVWLSVAGRVVIGGFEAPEFVEVAAFPSGTPS